MKTTIQKLPKSQLEIKFEVSAEELKPFLEKAVLHLGDEVQIEGFRKGKAPKEVIEGKLGKEAIFQHATEDCIRESYVQAIKENNLEPLGQPDIEILKIAPDNPLEFKARIYTIPEINLPDYKGVVSQIKRKEIEVTKEEIDRLKKQKETQEKERLRDELLEKISDKTKIEIPAVLIESEKQRMIEGLKQQVSQMLGMSYDDYLKKINKTEKELMDSFSTEAEKKVKNSLILREIVKKENISVSEAELEKETNEFTKANPNIDRGQIKEYAESVIKNEKTFQLLEALIK
jgi:trigger factor